MITETDWMIDVRIVPVLTNGPRKQQSFIQRSLKDLAL